jgi:glutamate 5-kinase
MSTKIVAARLATSAGVTTVITRSSKPGNIANIVRYVESLEKPTDTSSPIPPSTPTKQVDLSRSTSSLRLDELLARPLHTRFLPDPHPIRDRYFWLLHGLAPHGTLYIDEGAAKALSERAGLLPVGVVDVEGPFAQQESVRLVVVRRTHRPGTPSSNGDTSTSSSTSNNNNNNTSNSYETVDGISSEIGRALVNYSSGEISRIKGLQSTEIHTVLGYADSSYVALRENISFFKRGVSRPSTPSLGPSHS